MLSLAILSTVLAAASAVSAHGWIDQWTIGAQNYTGYNPTIAPWEPDQGTISWPACVESVLISPSSGSYPAHETTVLFPL